MARIKYVGKCFCVTYTLQEEGPHPTIAYDYYDDTYTITAVLQGEGICYVEGTANPLAEGTIVVLSPEEIRSFHLKQTGPHERISLYFSGEILSPMWEYELPLMQLFHSRTPGSGNRYTPDRYDTGAVTQILEKLRQALFREDDTQKEALVHLLILSLLFALYDAGNVQAEPEKEIGQDRVIGEICKYIKEHIQERLDYKYLQERFFVSRYQLTDVFRRNMGMTLTEYIQNKRLVQAMSLVRRGEGIENAAYKAGFRTYSHFYKVFKKHYGVSPKQYYFGKKGTV